MGLGTDHPSVSGLNVKGGAGVKFDQGVVIDGNESSIYTNTTARQTKIVGSQLKVTCGSTEFTNIVNFTGSGKTAVQTDGYNTPTGAIKVGVGFDYHYIIVRHGIVIDVLDTKSGYAEIWKWQ